MKKLSNTIFELSLREWLELGQAMYDKRNAIDCEYFRKWHTSCIHIGNNCKIKADGKIYKSGEYYLNDDL